MPYIHRFIENALKKTIQRNKSVLLLGPRQTGKTTLIEHLDEIDLSYSFLETSLRRRFEENPDLIIGEIKGFIRTKKKQERPTVFIDEVQKIPEIMDPLQLAIDQKLANFIITGSSARRLKHNLLPGRVVELHLDALSLLEIDHDSLEDLILNGSLPEIILQNDIEHKEHLLTSYVNLYLEEEVRAEALVRNLASFSRFLKYAAVDAGKILNISNLSKEVGVPRRSIEEYYQILEDCLIANRVDPIIDITTRRRLTKAPKYLLFDLGIRRIAAGEGLRLPERYFGDLFEQFIGIELIKLIRMFAPQARLRYWRDHSGPEIDYVIEYNHHYLPIEVKWTDKPSREDARHLRTFMKEYETMSPSYVVCRTPRPVELNEDVLAVNWKEISNIVRQFLKEF